MALGEVGRVGVAIDSIEDVERLFAGIDLDGTSVSQNRDDTEILYGAPQQFENVLKGNVGVPADAVPFVQTVAHYFVSAKGK